MRLLFLPVNRIAVIFALQLLVGGGGAHAAGAFRSQVDLFVSLAAEDSILAVVLIPPDGLELEVKAPNKPARRIRQSVQPAVLEKLAASAKAEGVPVVVQEAVREPAVASPLGEPAASDTRSVSAERKNRLKYVVSQSIFSFWAYGPALVGALELEGKAAAAVTLFAVTGSIAGQSIFAYRRSFEDAHISALSYMGTSAYLASYILPFLILGKDEDGARVGNFMVMGAYPLSLWAGYRHGNSYVDNPGRIVLEPVFAYPLALAGGLLLPLIYFGEDAFESDGDTKVRVMAGQALGFGVAGHFASRLYRAGEHIPRGVPGGIVAHTVLGLLAGATMVAIAEPEDGRGFGSLLLLGSATGFGEGLWFFRNRKDNTERSIYSLLGLAGGVAFGAGLAVLMEPDDAAMPFTVVTLSALAGYALTYSLLTDQVEKTAYRAEDDNSRVRSVSLNILPVPELRQLADSRYQLGYRIPGVTLRF